MLSHVFLPFKGSVTKCNGFSRSVDSVNYIGTFVLYESKVCRLRFGTHEQRHEWQPGVDGPLHPVFKGGCGSSFEIAQHACGAMTDKELDVYGGGVPQVLHM